MGRMGICFMSMATSWWEEACCLLSCFPTGTCPGTNLYEIWMMMKVLWWPNDDPSNSIYLLSVQMYVSWYISPLCDWICWSFMKYRRLKVLTTEAYIRHWLMRYYLDLVKIITRYEIIIAWYEIIKTYYAKIITLYAILQRNNAIFITRNAIIKF